MNSLSDVLPSFRPKGWATRLRPPAKVFRVPLFLFRISPMAPGWRQYVLAVLVFAAVSGVNFILQKWLGYQALALVYLLSVVLLALVINRGPILFGTLLTAAGWNYFFAPPVFAFNISDPYDNTMLVTYFVVTLTVGHLTTRLRAQREAELQSKLLVESERLGRTLLNSVSHELRTPIAAITSASCTLRSTDTLTLKQENLVTEVEAASGRLNRVVQSLLNAARLQSGQISPKLDWCEIADLLRAARQSIPEVSPAETIAVRIMPELPLLKADFVLMEQALANLAINAIMHTPPGTPVEICAYLRDSEIVLEVSDEGNGLPPDQLERVFEPFHRAPMAKTGGTGLGLAIVKGFVEAQGGRVKAANRAGGGAIFSILMPITDSPDLPKDDL